MTPRDAGVRLTKSDAERLMAAVDTDAFVAVLRSSLERLLPARPTPDSATAESWDDVIRRAGTAGQWDRERIDNLIAMDLDSLYDLAAELNERRTLR